MSAAWYHLATEFTNCIEHRAGHCVIINFWDKRSLWIVIPISSYHRVLQIPLRNCLRGPWRIAHEAFAHCKAGGPRVRRAVIVVLVDDGVDHDCLLVYGDRTVCGHRNPVVCQMLVSTANAKPQHSAST